MPYGKLSLSVEEYRCDNQVSNQKGVKTLFNKVFTPF